MRGCHHLGLRIEGDLVQLGPGNEQSLAVDASDLAKPQQRKLHGVAGAALVGSP